MAVPRPKLKFAREIRRRKKPPLTALSVAAMCDLLARSIQKGVTMQTFKKLSAVFIVALFVSAIAPWQSSAQDTKSGVVNSRDQILGVTTNQQTQTQTQPSGDPPADKGNPGPLPCNSKNNPKCEPVSKSKPGDGNNGNNGVGNGVDPQPPGNPPINDGPGTGPGNPGAGTR